MSQARTPQTSSELYDGVSLASSHPQLASLHYKFTTSQLLQMNTRSSFVPSSNTSGVRRTERVQSSQVCVYVWCAWSGVPPPFAAAASELRDRQEESIGRSRPCSCQLSTSDRAAHRCFATQKLEHQTEESNHAITLGGAKYSNLIYSAQATSVDLHRHGPNCRPRPKSHRASFPSMIDRPCAWLDSTAAQRSVPARQQ